MEIPRLNGVPSVEKYALQTEDYNGINGSYPRPKVPGPKGIKEQDE